MKKHFKQKTYIAVFVLMSALSACVQDKKDSTNRPQGSISVKTEHSPQTFVSQPQPKGLLNDFAKILDEDKSQEIESVLRQLQSKAEIDYRIAIVDSTDETSIFDYSLSRAREWNIGSKNGGVLLVVAVMDKKWHIQIDKRLEQDLSNEEVKQIGETMVEDFKQKKLCGRIEKVYRENDFGFSEKTKLRADKI